VVKAPLSVALCLSLLVLLLPGPAGALAGERVFDPAGLFSFVPPPGWTLSTVGTAQESQVRADLAVEGAWLTVSARPLPQGLDWPAWQAKLKESLSLKLNQPNFGQLKLCGQEALSAAGLSRENERILLEIVAFKKDGLGFVLALAYPAPAWARFRPIFERVLSSFSCRARP